MNHSFIGGQNNSTTGFTGTAIGARPFLEKDQGGISKTSGRI
jgi:hypothetical protein